MDHDEEKIDPRRLLPEMKDWFAEYCRSFDRGDSALQESIALKAEHTRKVCQAILDIGESGHLPEKDLCLAEIAALLHDIGRFEQFRKYRTFADYRSVNHATLGSQIIRDNHILDGLGSPTADVIIRVVECHNRVSLPEGESERCILFLKLLRDADKIDIWRVVAGYYRNAGNSRNRTIELDLPDPDRISAPVFEALMSGKLVQMSDVRTLQDFKLLQMGWIYDLNFPRSFQIVKEKKYLGAIRDALPRDSLFIEEVYERARVYLEQNIAIHEQIK